jgi:hypothetical protein
MPYFVACMAVWAMTVGNEKGFVNMPGYELRQLHGPFARKAEAANVPCEEPGEVRVIVEAVDAEDAPRQVHQVLFPDSLHQPWPQPPQ